jgi:hypothetical protein
MIINILYFLPSFFYLVLLYTFPEAPHLDVKRAIDDEFTCIFAVEGSCLILAKLGYIIDRVAPIILLALWWVAALVERWGVNILLKSDCALLFSHTVY